MVIPTARRVNVRTLVLPELATRRLLIVTGKGGVGKTTVAAALALTSAREGARTLVCEVNTKERITSLLGKPEVGAEVTSIEENLWAVNVQPQEAMREYALMILKFESIYSAVFENRLVRYFLRFIPSLQELVLLGKILFHLKEKRPDGSWRFDRIIVDAPATGHAITVLSVPQVIIDTVPPGAMASEAAWMRDLLVDKDTTAVVLVSLPEELPVNETIDLDRALTDRVKLRAQLVVLNGFIHRRFQPGEVGDQVPPALREVARVHDVRAALSATSLHRLASLKLPIVTVPRFFSPAFNRNAIELVAGTLARGPQP
jgi:cellulose biosynthesis protein BcsQ